MWPPSRIGWSRTEPSTSTATSAPAGGGLPLIAGADEAGRGALAGPLVAAAVILPEGFELEGIDDSKMLTAAPAGAAFERIIGDARRVAVCRRSRARIDRRGLHIAQPLAPAPRRRRLDPAPDFVLTDGFPVRAAARSRPRR